MLASVPAGTAASEGPPREPPATPGAARATAATGLPGFPRCFLFWGGCGRLGAGVAGAGPAPVCSRLEGGARETAGGGAPPRHGHATGGSQPAHGPRRTARPGAETSPGLLAAPEQVGDPAAGGESARRNCAAGGTWRTAPATRTPPPRPRPPRQLGATDGNHGQSTGTGGGLRQRQHTESGQSPGPATSPTTSAISLLPTVQQRGSVRQLQSPRHHTISWNGVYQDESAASGPPFQRNGQYGHASHMTLGDGSASFGLRVLRPRGMQTRFLPRLLFLTVWALRRTRP